MRLNKCESLELEVTGGILTGGKFLDMRFYLKKKNFIPSYYVGTVGNGSSNNGVAIFQRIEGSGGKLRVN